MSSLSVRRWVHVFSFVSLSSIFLYLYGRYAYSLDRSQFFSGWVLLTAIVFLAAYNVRKKLPFIPLGSSATWLQTHLNVGWLTFLIFAIHLDLRFPTGAFESVLAALYLTVAVSGVFGLCISRIFPRRLSQRGRDSLSGDEEDRRRHGEEVIFERIPVYRRQLREWAEVLVLESAKESASPTIAAFYRDRLHCFFAFPRNFVMHVIGSGRPLHLLMAEFTVVRRYLSDADRATLDKLEQVVRAKNDLDYSYSLQFVLKSWLFVHVPLTYGLLVFAVFHGVLVYAFAGGSR